jgi:hypothetical protein
MLAADIEQPGDLADRAILGTQVRQHILRKNDTGMSRWTPTILALVLNNHVKTSRIQ